MDLRTNPFQEGGDDGRGPSTSPYASPPKGIFGPTTRVMAKRIQEDWNAATDGRETFLYMFKLLEYMALNERGVNCLRGFLKSFSL